MSQQEALFYEIKTNFSKRKQKKEFNTLGIKGKKIKKVLNSVFTQEDYDNYLSRKNIFY